MASKGLSDTQIKNAKPGAKAHRLYDRDRLYLDVSVAGSKRWYWRYRLGDKDHTYTIGKYPDVSLKDARAIQAVAAKEVAQGLPPTPIKVKVLKANPVSGTTSASTTTDTPVPGSLWAVCTEWLEKKTNWGAGHETKVRNLLTRYVRDGALGSRPVEGIQAYELRQLLESVAVRTSINKDAGERKASAPRSAIVVQRALNGVFRLAVTSPSMKGKLKVNPMADLRASDVIDKPVTVHNAKLDDKGLTALLVGVDAYGGLLQTKLAIRLLMLTALRTIEVRGADWKEIDFEAKVWTVPAGRMKMKVEHKVPLSVQTLEVLEKLKVLTGGKGWLFPNNRRPTEYMASTTVNSALTAMELPSRTHAHGFRGTFYSWALRNKYQSEAADQQLAHKERDPVKRAYLAENSEQFWSERVAMMDAWGSYLQGLKDGQTAED